MERTAVAMGIGNCKVDGVAVVVCRGTVLQDVTGLLGIEELRAFRKIRCGDESFSRHVADCRIRYPPRPICESDP